MAHLHLANMSAMISLDQGARVFHVFPNLPSELQKTIWDRAAVEDEATTIIKLMASRAINENGEEVVRFSTDHMAHALLSTCIDARNAKLKILPSFIEQIGIPRKIRHRPEDVILLWQPNEPHVTAIPQVNYLSGTRHVFLEDAFKSIKHLAVINAYGNNARLAEFVRHCGSLTSITTLGLPGVDYQPLLKSSASLRIKAWPVHPMKGRLDEFKWLCMKFSQLLRLMSYSQIRNTYVPNPEDMDLEARQ